MLTFAAVRPLWALSAAAILCSASAQAQSVFGDLLGSRNPTRVELTESSDIAAAYANAFQQPGALAHAFRRPDFKQRTLSIGSFEVEFATEQVGSSKGSGGAQGVSYNYFLRNVSDAQMQAITDQAYAQFVEMVKARGYEVLPTSAMAATSFREQLASASATPVKKERGALSKMMGKQSSDVDNASALAVAAGTAPYPGMQFMSAGPLGKLATETNAIAVGVRLKLNFTRIDDAGGIAYSEVDAKPRNVLAAAASKISIYAPDGNLWDLPIFKPVVLPGAVADQAVRMEVKGEEKAKAAASVGIGLLAGFLGVGGRGGIAGAAGGVSGQNIGALLGESSNYEITATPDYETRVGNDLALAIKIFAEALPK